MESRTNILLLGSNLRRAEQVRSKLASSCNVRSEDFHAVLSAHRLGAPLAIVDLAEDVDAAIAAMEELARSGGPVKVIAMAATKDPELILRAMRAGAREFVVLDGSDELVTVVEKLRRQIEAAAGSGHIVTVFPAKGGAGATFLATNLAGLVAESGKRVVLVDLDLQLGDVLVTLDMTSQYAISDVLQNMQRLDRELLSGSLAKHPSGIHVLSQSDRLEEADRVTAAKIGAILTFLARHYDYVVVDGVRGFDEMSIAALDVSHQVLLVLAQTVPALRNAQRCLEVFRRLRYGDDKVKVVVNRYQKNDSIDLDSVRESLGTSVTGLVSNEYKTVMAAINRGRLLHETASRSKVAQDLRQVAGAIGAVGLQKKGGSFFGKLFGKKEAAPKNVIPLPKQQNREEGVRSEQPKRAPETI
jgi:pilus assembly protein CpaE